MQHAATKWFGGNISVGMRVGAIAFALLGWTVTTACDLEEGDDDGDIFSDTGTDTSNDTGGDTGNNTRTCNADGFCNTSCSNDPDCGCACDRQGGRCDASFNGSSANCACDNDCRQGGACLADNSCDSFCPNDPDCQTDTECECDFYNRVCEASRPGSSSECACDDDCSGSRTACGSDGHCDTFCPRDTDPDCRTSPTCNCDYNEGICEAEARNSTNNCACDDDCAGTSACKSDGHCDSWCPSGIDPDCR